MEDYLVDLYGWISSTDPTFEEREPYEEWKKKIGKDQKYQEELYGWISSVDNTFEEREPYNLWADKVKKKDDSQLTSPDQPLEYDTPVVQDPGSSDISQEEVDAALEGDLETIIGEVPDEFGGGDVTQFEAGRRRRGQQSEIDKSDRDMAAENRRRRDEGLPPIATGEKDTMLERALGKNEVTDFFGDLWRAGAKGYETGNTVDEALELSLKGASASKEDIADFVRVNEQLSATGPSDEMKAFNKAYSEAGGGAWGFIKGIMAAPTSITEIAVTSVAQMVNPAVAAGAGTGAVTGGLAGSTGFSAGPLGVFTTAGGAIAGALGGAGATLEAGLSFSEFLQEELSERGLEFNEKNVGKILQDEDAMFNIRTKSAGRGATIGIIDAFTGGIAGKIFKGVGKTAIKAGKTAKRANLKALGASTVVEGLGGGVGEATARGLVGQEMDAAEIGFEIVGGAPGSAITMLRNVAGRGKYTMGPDNAPVTFEQMVKIIEETDDATFAGMKLKIKGDQVLKGMAEDRKDKLRQKKAKMEQLGEDLDGLSAEDAEAAIELETELDKVSGGLTRAKKNRKKEIESQLDEIYSRRQEPAVEAVVEVTEAEVFNEIGRRAEEDGRSGDITTAEEIESVRQELLKQKQDAIQESSATEVDVQEQTQDGAAVGEGDTTGGVTVESESETEVSPEATQEEIEQGAGDLEDLLAGLTDSPVNLGDGTRGRNVMEAAEETSVEVVSDIDEAGDPVMAPAQPGVEVSENLTVVDQTETDSHYGSENFRRENPNETPQQHEEMLMERVDKALKSVKRLFPKLKIVMHRSEASYKDNVSTNSRGAFNPNTNTIHINMPKAMGRTIGHEVFHAILKDRFGSEVNIQAATKDLIKSLREGINKSTNLTPEQVLELERYAQIFDGDKAIVQDEEFLAEFVGFLSETYSKLEVPQQTAIKQWLAKIAQIFGFSPQEVLAQTDRDVVDLLNTIAEKVTEGQEITETDVAMLGTEEKVQGERDTQVTERQVLEPKAKAVIEGGQKVSEPASALKTQAIGAFEVSYTQQEKVAQMIKDGLITEPDDVSFLKGNDTVITSPDDMLVGEISLNGKPIFEGGGGVFFVTKYGDVWAAGKKATAEQIARGINRGLKENGGKGYLTLTKGADKKLVSSTAGVNSTLAILDSMLDEGLVSPSNFRAAVSSAVKRAGGEIDLRGSSKKLKADVNEYFSDPSTTTFEKRGNIVESIVGEIAKSLPKELRPKVVQFLGGDPNKSVGATKTPKSQRLVDLVAGVAAEKLTKGLKTGDVYAVIEVDGEVEVVKGDHKSYPWHVKLKDGSKPILHLPKNREAGGKALVQKSGKPYAVRNVSVVEGKFQGQTEGIKTQAYSDDLMYQYGKYTDKNGELDVDLVLEKINEDIASLKNKDLIEEKLRAFEELIIPAISEDITSPALTQFEEDVLMDPNATGESIARGFSEAKNIIDKEGSIDFKKTKESELFKGGEINRAAFERFVKNNPEYQGVFNDWEKLSTENTESVLQDLNAFNVVDIKLAESFKKQLQETDIKTQAIDGDIKTQIFNKNMTVEDIIKFGRENNFSDAMIKDYLVRIRKEKVKEVNKMMAIDADMFRQMPVSFGNIEGGARAGVKLFARVEKFMNKLNAKNNKRKEKNRLSVQELGDQTIEFLEKQPEYIAESGKRKQETDQQTQMIIDMQKALGINSTKGMNTRVREMRQKMMERRRGGMDLQAVKRDLRNFIRQALPTIKGSAYSKSELMNLLGKVTKADKKNIANLMDEVVDIVTKRQVKALDSKIESILNGKYEVVQSGRLKGVKIDNETRKRLAAIKEVVTDEAATADDIVKSNESLNEMFNALAEKVDQTDQDRNDMVDLMIVMSINNSKLMDDTNVIKVESLSRAEEMLSGIIGEGREMFKEELQAAHAKYNEQFAKVFKDVTGRDVDVNDPDVVNEINEATDDLKRSAEATKANDNKVVKFIKSLNPKNLFVKSETIEGLMERIAEAPGVLLGGNARKLVYEGLNEGIRGYKKRMMETKKAVSGKMKEVYGKKWRRTNKDNSVKQVVEGIYTNPEAVKKAQDQYDANPTRKNKKNLQKVKGEKAITLSKNQVGYLYMQMKDPANVPAFENMKSLLGEDYKRTMDELVEWAGKDVVAMAEWQMNEFYPSMYPEINEAYKNIYRTDLPWNENYGGRMYREGEVIQPLDLLGEKGRSPQANSQVAAASTKMRQARSKPIMPVDMMNALVTYSQDMQWFANVGPTIRDINKLFTNPLMRKAITNAKGEVTMDMIDHAIKNIANRGLQTERGNDFVNSMNNLFATTRLGISPNIAIKQLTSIPTYALDIGAGNYLYYAVKNKTEFLKVFNEIRENSVYLQDRLSTDIRQSIEAYSAKGLDGSDPASGVFTKGAGSFFVNLMMGFVKAGDITAIYLGGMPNYSYYKAEFMRENPQATPQEAIDYAVRKFESDTKSTQQSMDVTDKDYFQTSSPFNRALNMFKTSPKQYLRKEMSGLRNMRRGFRDKNLKQFMDGLNKFLMYHVMMPVGFQFVAAGMGLAGWDEEDNKDIARAAILGNFNSLFLVGDILQGLSNTLAGRTYGKDVGTLPVFDAFGEINEQYLKWNRLKDPEKKEEAFIRMTTRIGELALAGRIPLYNITRFYKNIEKAADASDTQEAILRLLNYSDYVIEGNERDTQSAPKTREERDAERDTETSRKKREEEKRRKDRDKRGRR
jgi:hypothetical protein